MKLRETVRRTILLSITLFCLFLTQCGKQYKLYLSQPPIPGYKYQIRYNDDLIFQDVESSTINLENKNSVDIQLIKSDSDRYYLKADSDYEFIKSYKTAVLTIDLKMMRNMGVFAITISPHKRLRKVKVSVEKTSDYVTVMVDGKSIGTSNKEGSYFWLDEFEPDKSYKFYTREEGYDTLYYSNFDQLPYKVVIPAREKAPINIDLSLRDRAHNPVSNVEVLLGNISLGKTDQQGHLTGVYSLNLGINYPVKIKSESYLLADTAIKPTKSDEVLSIDLIADRKIVFELSIMDKYTKEKLRDCDVLYQAQLIGKTDRKGHFLTYLLEKNIGQEVVFQIKKNHWKGQKVKIKITGAGKYVKNVYLEEKPFFSITLKDALTKNPLEGIMVRTKEGFSAESDKNGKARIYLKSPLPYRTEINFHSDDNLFEDFTKQYSVRSNRQNFTEIIPTKLKLTFRFKDTEGNPVRNVSFMFNGKSYRSGNRSVKAVIEGFNKTLVPLSVEKEYYKSLRKDLDISQSRSFQVTLEALFMYIICESSNRPVEGLYVYLKDDEQNKVRTDQNGKAKVPIKRLNERCEVVINDPEKNFESKSLTTTPISNGSELRVELKPLPVLLVEVYDPDLREIGGIPVYIDNILQGETDKNGRLKVVLDSFTDYVNISISPDRFQPIEKKIYIKSYPHTEQFQLSYLTGYFHAINVVTGEEITDFKVTWKGRSKNSIAETKKVAWALEYVPVKMTFSAESPGMEPITNQTCEFKSRNSDSNHVVIRFRPSRKRVRIRFTDQTGNTLSDAEVHATLLNQKEAHFVDASTNIKKRGIISLDLYPYKYRLNYTVMLQGQPVSDVDSIDVNQINEKDNIHKKIVVLNMTRLVILTDNDVNVIVKSINDVPIGVASKGKWINRVERNTQYKIFLEKNGQILLQGEILAQGNEMVKKYPWPEGPLPILIQYINNRKFDKADQYLREIKNDARKQYWYSDITFKLGSGFKTVRTIEAQKKSVYWYTEAIYAPDSRIKGLNDIMEVFRSASNMGMGYQSIQLFEKLYSMTTLIPPDDRLGFINDLVELWTYGLRNNLEIEYAPGTDNNKIMRFLYCPVEQDNDNSDRNVGAISEADLWLNRLDSYIELAGGNTQISNNVSFIKRKIEQLRSENPEPSEGYRCQ